MRKLIMCMLLLSFGATMVAQKKVSYIGILPQSNRIKVYEIYAIDSMVLVSGSKYGFDVFLLYKLRGFALISNIKVSKSSGYHGNLCYAALRQDSLYVPVGPYSKETIVISLKDSSAYITKRIYPFIAPYRERKKDNNQIEMAPFEISFDRRGVKVFMYKDYYNKLRKEHNVSPQILKNRIMSGLW